MSTKFKSCENKVLNWQGWNCDDDEESRFMRIQSSICENNVLGLDSEVLLFYEYLCLCPNWTLKPKCDSEKNK